MGFIHDFTTLSLKSLFSKNKYIIFYFFICPLDNNFFICSYLLSISYELDYNYYCFTPILLTYLLFNVLDYTPSLGIINNYFINLIYISKLNFSVTKYYINLNKLKLLSITSYFKNLLLINLIKNIYFITVSNFNSWFPIYKSYSIYGYYKSTRLKFIDYKNENLKNIKY